MGAELGGMGASSHSHMGTDASTAHPPSTHYLLQTRSGLTAEKSLGETI